MRRVLIMGLDGGCPQLIEKWKDKLPNFKRIIDGGVSGILRSTNPPLTCPAWNCFATGKNPGRLGLYDWCYLHPDHSLKLSKWAIFDSPNIWQMLGEAGKKVGAISVPLTYPAKAVNGFVISGWPGSVERNDYTYPKELARQINQLVGRYDIEPSAINPDYLRGGPKRFLHELNKYNDKIFITTKYMMEQHHWDFLTVVFISTDRVQHFFWHYMDKDHPKYYQDNRLLLKDAVFQTYQKLDAILGNLLTLTTESTYIFVISDHGFGPYHGSFAINTWLQQKGFLVLKHSKAKAKPNLLMKITDAEGTSLGLVKALLAKTGAFELGKRLWLRFSKHGGLNLSIQAEASLLEQVDWTQTRAIGVSGSNEIYLNKEIMAETECQRVKDEVIAALHEIRDPLTSGKAITQVYTAEEIYGERCLGYPPDIIYVLGGHKYDQKLEIDSPSLWRVPGRRSGNHRPEGLIMAKGPAIKRGSRIDAEIVDITPTVLHIFGLPIPEEIDGRALTEIFESDSGLAKSPIICRKINEREQLISKIRKLKKSDMI